MSPPARRTNLPGAKQERRHSVIFAIVFAISCLTFYSLFEAFAGQFELSVPKVGEEQRAVSSSTRKNQGQHNAAAGLLSCQQYGGPSDEVAAGMVYWKNITSDALHVSPLKHPEMEQYLTFEKDEGGWNNMRMALETMVTMAIATGRTLVLPPTQNFWNLDKKHPNSEKQHKTVFSFADFYHFDDAMEEHVGFKVISFEEFLKTVAMKGRLEDQETGTVSYPPGNRTDWNNLGNWWERAKEGQGKILWGWLRSVTTQLTWNSDNCVATFPRERGKEAIKQVNEAYDETVNFYKWAFGEKAEDWKVRASSYDSNPTPVDAPPQVRLAEILADRHSDYNLCLYDHYWQDKRVIHMTGDQEAGYRYLVHFYAFLFFEDWKQDLWTKRFARDHMRYRDDIQCAAARVVEALQEKAKMHSLQAFLDNGTKRTNIEMASLDNTFDSMHVRRNDFKDQFKEMLISAHDIYNKNTKGFLKDERTVFIATDERNKDYFGPLREHYHIYFLDDFKEQIIGTDLNPNYYGMVDQLVASRGQTFVGTYLSTFSGYINRIRGYHSQMSQSTGYEQGIIDSYYYVPDSKAEKREVMRKYHTFKRDYWQQEFPVAWRDIEFDASNN